MTLRRLWVGYLLSFCNARFLLYLHNIDRSVVSSLVFTVLRVDQLYTAEEAAKNL